MPGAKLYTTLFYFFGGGGEVGSYISKANKTKEPNTKGVEKSCASIPCFTKRKFQIIECREQIFTHYKWLSILFIHVSRQFEEITCT